jgi:hypothetical protein
VSDLAKWTGLTKSLGDVPLTQMCNCIGPQNGQPLCPCQMRGVEVATPAGIVGAAGCGVAVNGA